MTNAISVYRKSGALDRMAEALIRRRGPRVPTPCATKRTTGTDVRRLEVLGVAVLDSRNGRNVLALLDQLVAAVGLFENSKTQWLDLAVP